MQDEQTALEFANDTFSSKIKKQHKKVICDESLPLISDKKMQQP